MPFLQPINDLDFHPQNTVLISGAKDHTIKYVYICPLHLWAIICSCFIIDWCCTLVSISQIISTVISRSFGFFRRSIVCYHGFKYQTFERCRYVSRILYWFLRYLIYHRPCSMDISIADITCHNCSFLAPRTINWYLYQIWNFKPCI